MRYILDRIKKFSHYQERYVFVSFSGTVWDGPWYVRQKLMNELAKEHKVIYVNPRKDLRAVLSQLASGKFYFGLKKYGKNILLVESPWLFPKIYRFPIIDDIIDKLYHRFIKLLMLLYGFNKIKILYIWEYTFSNMIRHYGGIPYVYHIYDLLSAYTYVKDLEPKDYSDRNDGIQQKMIKSSEEKIVKDALLLYAVSDNLCEYYLERYQRRPKLFPNGVSENYFEDNVIKCQNIEILKKLESIRTKKIAYAGSIIGSLNLDIVMEAARNLKDYSFIFIGEIRYTGITEYDKKTNDLFTIDNIYHIESVSIDDLPDILRQMDILLFLYSQDKDIWTYYSFPAKLFEYFAIGLPIISTPHPVINNYQEYISIVDDADQLISAILLNTSGEIQHNSYKMRRLAKDNSWTRRKGELVNDLRIALSEL